MPNDPNSYEHWMAEQGADVTDDDDCADEPECPRCHGDGRDPWNDYLLPCPGCTI